MRPLAAFPMHYYPAARCNPILPFNSQRSRLPNQRSATTWRLRSEQPGSKVRLARDPPKTRKSGAPMPGLLDEVIVRPSEVATAGIHFRAALKHAGTPGSRLALAGRSLKHRTPSKCSASDPTVHQVGSIRRAEGISLGPPWCRLNKTREGTFTAASRQACEG
jgi:hypothetical protein